MPHSSGGGHSHHGSHGSSRSKSSEMRYGKRYYRGSLRYVYYLNGTPQYYFSDRPYTLQSAKSEKIKKIFSNILSAIFGLIFALTGFFSLPHKVKLDYDTEIVIHDSAQLLSDTEEKEMTDAFSSFLDKTGVTPALFTIFDTELEKQGSNLHDYAYRLYVNTFDDEKHWLVVYCIDDEEEYWSWEGMIGDDCGSIITTDLENEFTSKLQNNLEKNPGMLSSSVIDAFKTIGDKSGKMPPKKILGLAAAIVFGAVVLFSAVKSIIAGAKKQPSEDPRINSVECPTSEEEPETTECQYCGKKFVSGLHTSCPHCGAPIEEKWE